MWPSAGLFCSNLFIPSTKCASDYIFHSSQRTRCARFLQPIRKQLGYLGLFSNAEAVFNQQQVRKWSINSLLNARLPPFQQYLTSHHRITNCQLFALNYFWPLSGLFNFCSFICTLTIWPRPLWTRGSPPLGSCTMRRHGNGTKPHWWRIGLSDRATGICFNSYGIQLQLFIWPIHFIAVIFLENKN